MSKSGKQGLDYFSFDVDFFDDEKIQFVSAKYGNDGELAAVKLLCRIYRNGYYYNWGTDESLLFSKVMNVNHALLEQVIDELVKRDFFNKRIYDSYLILTSRGIQKRYLGAAKRRKDVEIIKEIMLLDFNDYINVENVNIISLNDDIGATKESKEKVKEKEKKRKVRVRDYVTLHTHEIEKLKNDFGEQAYEWMVDRLDNYKGSRGKRYKDDYRAILSWVVNSYREEKEKSSAKKEKERGLEAALSFANVRYNG